MANNGLTEALAWLSRRRMTTAEVRERLGRLGIPAGEQEAVIARLIELGLMDDAAYAEDLIARAGQGREGPLRLRARLDRRGFDPALIDRTLEAAALDWSRIAERLAARYDVSDPRARVRLMRRMSREGFPAAVIRQLWENRGDGE